MMDDATQKLVDKARTRAEQRWPIPANYLPGDPERTFLEAQRHAYVLGRLDEAAQRPQVSPTREEIARAIDPNALELEAYAWPLDAADRVVALLSAQRPPVSPEVAEALPVVAHKGPHDTDESMFLTAADNLDRGYPLGGGNLTRAVVELIRREVKRARFSFPSQPVYDEEAIARFTADALREDGEGFGSCDFPRDFAAALVAALRGGELTREETNRG